MSSYLGTSPIIAIVGQTASGKTALGIKLARKYGGEVIAADSRTVYKGLGIGTAKPTPDEQSQVLHHGLDLIDPAESFSAADFKHYALQKIDEIQRRGRIPFVVGGSGLYIDGLLYNFTFGTTPEQQVRDRLELMSIEELEGEARRLGIGEDQVNLRNKRHLARAVERVGSVVGRDPLPQHVLVIGLKIDKEQLTSRIEERVAMMFDNGLVTELEAARETWGFDAPALSAPGYKAIGAYLDEKASLSAAKNMFITSDKKLAKRQMTWFKRNQDIKWVETEQQADKLIGDFLLNFDTITPYE